METSYVDLDMGNGEVLRAEIVGQLSPQFTQGRVTANMDDVVPWITRLGATLHQAVAATGAKNAEAEFGLKLEGGTGSAVKWALDVKGEASLKVTLKWEL